GLGDEIRLGSNSWLDPGGGEFFLQIRIVIKENSGPELGRLFDTGGLFPVVADQGLCRLSFLDDKSEGKILVADDLLVIEQLDESIVGDVLDIGVAAIADQ